MGLGISYTVSFIGQRLALKESNISRYKEEFHEVCIIGKGSFGTVYKCINRLGKHCVVIYPIMVVNVTCSFGWACVLCLCVVYYIRVCVCLCLWGANVAFNL